VTWCGRPAPLAGQSSCKIIDDHALPLFLARQRTHTHSPSRVSLSLGLLPNGAVPSNLSLQCALFQKPQTLPPFGSLAVVFTQPIDPLPWALRDSHVHRSSATLFPSVVCPSAEPRQLDHGGRLPPWLWITVAPRGRVLGAAEIRTSGGGRYFNRRVPSGAVFKEVRLRGFGTCPLSFWVAKHPPLPTDRRQIGLECERMLRRGVWEDGRASCYVGGVG
jgi:hypothetical protein